MYFVRLLLAIASFNTQPSFSQSSLRGILKIFEAQVLDYTDFVFSMQSQGLFMLTIPAPCVIPQCDYLLFKVNCDKICLIDNTVFRAS